MWRIPPPPQPSAPSWQALRQLFSDRKIGISRNPTKTAPQGGDLFLFTHLLVEVSVLFIYLFEILRCTHYLRERVEKAGTKGRSGEWQHVGNGRTYLSSARRRRPPARSARGCRSLARRSGPSSAALSTGRTATALQRNLARRISCLSAARLTRARDTIYCLSNRLAECRSIARRTSFPTLAPPSYLSRRCRLACTPTCAAPAPL